jgi:hypothetical protein
MQWLRQHVIAAARRELRQAQDMAKLLTGRNVRHILLLHMSAFNSLTLAEVLAALQADGVKFIDLPTAMKDPIYRRNPGLSLSGSATLLEQLLRATNPYGEQVKEIEAMCKPSVVNY